MTELANQVLQGILLGGYYAIIGCGLSFMYGVMGIINIAHGSLVVVAAFGLFVLADRFGLSPLSGLLIVVPCMAVLGVLLQRLVLERSAKAGPLVPVLSTFGLSIVIDNLLFQGFGADTRSLAPFMDSLAYDSWPLSGDIAVGQLPALTFAAAAVLLSGLHVLLAKTSIGRKIRATAEDHDTAGLVGVNTAWCKAVAVALSMVGVALAAFALGMRSSFDAYSGAPQLIFAFEVAVIGGAGSLWGTLVGGMLLGVAQTLGSLIAPQCFLIAGHIMFLLVLLTRPALKARTPAILRAMARGAR